MILNTTEYNPLVVGYSKKMWVAGEMKAGICLTFIYLASLGG
jgi:hypothetical protein